MGRGRTEGDGSRYFGVGFVDMNGVFFGVDVPPVDRPVRAGREEIVLVVVGKLEHPD